MAIPYDLPADVLFTDAARCVLSAAFRTMIDNAAETRTGLLRREPTEAETLALHDMRVGSRRLRAALSVFGSVLPREEFCAFDRQIGKITDALGLVRDCDVQIETLQKLCRRLPENEAYGVERLIARQRKRRDKGRVVLLTALETLEKNKFERRFVKALNRALASSARFAEGAPEDRVA